MAKRDVEEYYQQVCRDYKEMLDTLTDMEDAFNQNMVSEEQLNNVKNMIVPLKSNYMTLSWIMYLLYKPQRKEKADKFDREMTKFKSDKDINRDKLHVLTENQEVLNKLKNFSFK